MDKNTCGECAHCQPHENNRGYLVKHLGRCVVPIPKWVSRVEDCGWSDTGYERLDVVARESEACQLFVKAVVKPHVDPDEDDPDDVDN